MFEALLAQVALANSGNDGAISLTTVTTSDGTVITAPSEIFMHLACSCVKDHKMSYFLLSFLSISYAAGTNASGRTLHSQNT